MIVPLSIDYNLCFECDRPQTLIKGALGVASYPGPSERGGERAWYTLHAHALGDPRKMWGNWILLYTLHLSSTELYVMQNLRMNTVVTRPVAMETPVHARAVYQALSLPLEGPGNEARLGAAGSKRALQQRCAIHHFISSMVFYHCIHNSQSISAHSP